METTSKAFQTNGGIYRVEATLSEHELNQKNRLHRISETMLSRGVVIFAEKK